MMVVIVWFVVALVFAFISAGMANSRGRSGGLWGILGFFFGIFTVLILAIIGNDTSSRASNMQVGYQPVSTPPASKFDEIAKLKALLDSGVLTQAEFDIQKAKLLS